MNLKGTLPLKNCCNWAQQRTLITPAPRQRQRRRPQVQGQPRPHSKTSTLKDSLQLPSLKERNTRLKRKMGSENKLPKAAEARVRFYFPMRLSSCQHALLLPRTRAQGLAPMAFPHFLLYKFQYLWFYVEFFDPLRLELCTRR